jgi:hypothetical protein
MAINQAQMYIFVHMSLNGSRFKGSGLKGLGLERGPRGRVMRLIECGNRNAESINCGFWNLDIGFKGKGVSIADLKINS